MKPPPAKGRRRWSGSLGWVVWAALFAAVPKCAICLFAYGALVAGARVELCGAQPAGGTLATAAEIVAIALLGIGLALHPARTKK